MSFGLSVTDFLTCACVAYKLCQGFKNAPAECATFTQALHTFAFVLKQMAPGELSNPDESIQRPFAGRTEYEQFFNDCIHLLCVQISGMRESDLLNLGTLQDLDANLDARLLEIGVNRPENDRRMYWSFDSFQARRKQSIAALKVPDYRLHISRQMEKQITFATMHLRYGYFVR